MDMAFRPYPLKAALAGIITLAPFMDPPLSVDSPR